MVASRTRLPYSRLFIWISRISFSRKFFRSSSLGLASSLALASVTCSSSTAPSATGNTVTTFFANSTAADGSIGTFNSGAAPPPSGGPSITVTAPSTVVSLGLEVVAIQSATPFQTVFASVDNATGFFKFALTAPTTETTLITTVASTVPSGPFTQAYSVATAAGSVGVSAAAPTTAMPSSPPAANVTGTWDLNGEPVFALTQNGSTVTGNEFFGCSQCQVFDSLPSGVTLSSVFEGTVSGDVLTGADTVTATGSIGGTPFACTEVDSFSLTISGLTMSGPATQGALNCNLPGLSAPPGSAGTLTLTKQ